MMPRVLKEAKSKKQISRLTRLVPRQARAISCAWLHALSSRQETASVSQQEVCTFNIYESCLT
jgi:hypothetical protein